MAGDLKDIWNKASEAQASLYLNKESIEKAIKVKERSGSLLDKLSRSLKFEFITCGILYLLVALISVFLNISLWSKIALFGMCLVIFPFMIYYYRKYKAINQNAISNSDLKTALVSITSEFDRFSKVYYYTNLVAGLVFIPVSLLVGTDIGDTLADPLGNSVSSVTQGTPENITIPELPVSTGGFIVLVIAIGLIYFFLVRWYMERLYKPHVKGLKKCLVELETEKEFDFKAAVK